MRRRAQSEKGAALQGRRVDEQRPYDERKTIKKKRPGGSETRPYGEWRMNVDLRFMWRGGVCAKMLGEA
jgi:hypothetical protein